VARRRWLCLGTDVRGNSSADSQHPYNESGATVIILGIILLLIGYFTSLSILTTIGGILVVVGVVLWILGAVGKPVGGRKVWF
jgi:membrane-bound ClpP family serine protease